MALYFSDQFDFSDQDFAEIHTKQQQAATVVREAHAKGELGFTKLPHADISGVTALAAELAQEFQDVVVIGIGGSDLGSRAVHRALNSPYYNLTAQRRNGYP